MNDVEITFPTIGSLSDAKRARSFVRYKKRHTLEVQIARSIRKIRRERHLKQRDFAKLLHTSQPQISLYERGVVVPPLRFLQKVATTCNTYIEFRINSTKRAELFRKL